jgi:Trypsin
MVAMVVFGGFIPLASTANAITYGSTVADLTKTAPYVVSIWTSPDNSQSDASFICTGSLIAPHIVLTAAHCTTDTGSYFVKVGSKALNDSTPFTSVSGVWHSAKYDPKTFQNDIGLLKINLDYPGITYPSLANSQVAQSINTKTNLQLFGWGRDQSGNLADLLRTTSIIPQDAAAAKYFRGTFKPVNMLAAGRKIQNQNLYSGGCSGDSGGPLVTNLNGITYVVGVTNWGAESCTKGTPTIFARVSSYLNEIHDGINSVETLAQVNDRTAPTHSVDPTIIGNVIPGQTLTCSPGVWQNALSVEISWISPIRIAGTTNPSVTVKQSDSGAQFRCRVIANSKNSSVIFNTQAKIRTPEDSLIVNPSINGIQSGVQAKVGNVARCDSWAWKIPVDSDSVAWFSTSTSNPIAPINARQLGSGPEITLTQDLIRSEKGRYLTCQVTGLLGGFSSFGTASVLISAPEAPLINSLSLFGDSLGNGSTVTCTYGTTGIVDTSLVEWGTVNNTNSGFTPLGITGSQIRITPAIIQQGSGKQISCRVTVSNAGGSTTRVVNSSNTFEIAPAAPIVSVRSYSWVIGNSAYCTASVPGSYGSNFTYQWGISSYPNSAAFDVATLSTDSTLPLTSDILIRSAGKYLSCQATTSNNAGSSIGVGSVSVPLSAAPSLPTISAPTVGNQNANSSNITATINIPSVLGFNPNTMDLRIHLGGSNCENQQITLTPTSLTCTGFSGSTNYNAYLTISYLSNTSNSNRSSSTSFTTIALTAPVLSPSALTANESIVGVIAYSGSGSSCPASNPVVAAEVNATTGASYTKCWPQAAWNAWLTGGTTWSNYLASFTALPTPSTPVIGSQTPGTSSISVDIQIPSIPNFDSSTMQAVLTVNGAPTCSGVVVTPNSTKTCSSLTANTTYSAYISVSRISGSSTPTKSTSVSFTTTALAAPALPACTGGTPTVKGLPTCLMPENLSGTAWNQVDNSTGAVLNSAVCSVSVCGRAGSWRTATAMNGVSTPGGYPVGSTYIQTPFNSAYWGQYYTNGVWVTSNGGIVQPGSSTITYNSALSPTFGSVNTSSTGFTVQILNYDSTYTWAAKITTSNSPGGSANINSSGLLTVSGLPSSTAVSVSVTTDKTGYPQGIGTINGTTLASADTTPPSITNNSLALTGYAPIIPTTGAPATSIQVRFGASDNIGIASTSVRLVNPGNVAVSTVSGTFLAGSTTSGAYQAVLATASSGPSNGDVYQIQAQASDAAGNSSGWVTIGTFTVQVASPKASIQVVVSPMDVSGVTNIGYCFNNASVISGTVTTSATISGPGYSGTQGIGTGAFLAYSGMPSCPNMVGGSAGFRLAPASTFTTSITAIANGVTYTNSTTFTTAAQQSQLPFSYSLGTGSSSLVVGTSTTIQMSGGSGTGVNQLVSNSPSICTISMIAGTNFANVTPLAAGTCSFTATKAADAQFFQQTGTGSYSVTAPALVAPASMSTSARSYGQQSTGRNFSFSVGIVGATSVTATATNGTTTISSPFTQGPNGDNWLYATSSLGGTTTYSGSMAIPSSATPGNYTLTYSATNSVGSTTQFNGGSFYIPAPVDPNAPALLSTQITDTQTSFNYGADSLGTEISLVSHFSNAISVSLTATLGGTVIAASFLPGPSGYTFVYRYSAALTADTTFAARMLFMAAQPKGTYSLTWTVTNQNGATFNFSAGTFTLS